VPVANADETRASEADCQNRLASSLSVYPAGRVAESWLRQAIRNPPRNANPKDSKPVAWGCLSAGSGTGRTQILPDLESIDLHRRRLVTKFQWAGVSLSTGTLGCSLGELEMWSLKWDILFQVFHTDMWFLSIASDLFAVDFSGEEEVHEDLICAFRSGDVGFCFRESSRCSM
jgi:hypothetical protein